MMTHRRIRALQLPLSLFVIAANFGPHSQAFADSQEATVIVPSDVFAAAVRMQSDIDNLRFYMGKPVADDPDFRVSNAQPREVYFAARSVFLKANEFAAQMTGIGQSREIPLDLRDIKPANVLEIVKAADGRIIDVLQKQGLQSRTESPPWGDGKTPSDVYMTLLGVSGQLNLLMDRPFTPGDVYREVMRAVNFAKHLLALYDDYEYPREPDFVPGRTPSEVHASLLDCFEIIGDMAKNLEMEILTVDRYSRIPGAIVPGDVYDVASLVVSELAYIYVESKATIPITIEPDPGRKWPSHVYQKVSFLKRQLNELKRLTSKNPAVLIALIGDRPLYALIGDRPLYTASVNIFSTTRP